MRDSEALRRLVAWIEVDGQIRRGSDGVVLLSGGADSACLAAALVGTCGPQAVSAVHVNYGLRPDSGDGEAAARALCAKLRIDLHIERPALEGGNVQARARAARYEAAERLRAKLAADWIASGHTRTDLAETLIYRLAVSPGSRGLIGLRSHNGTLIRPLLAVTREETRAMAREAGLPFADDPTNQQPVFARNRIRGEIMPLLEEIGPEVERNVAETHAELVEQAEFLDELAASAIREAGSEAGIPIRHEELATMHPALRRVVLTRVAEAGAQGPVRISRAQAAKIVSVAADPEGGTIELGRGVRAIGEAGTVRFESGEGERAPEPVQLTIPGRARYGDWEIRAELVEDRAEPGGPEFATLDAERLGGEVEIRCWREGDRIRPLGLDGSKSLQDLFTDSGVPRSLRRRLPVLVADERIAWVAGVAVSEEFRLEPDSGRSAVITARAVGRDER